MNTFFNLATFFYEVSKKYKNDIALRYDNQNITYDELNKLSNRIANYFISNNIKHGDVVGIFNTKECSGFASMLACLKIGATYTNIDEENPSKRIESILKTCETKLLLTDHKVTETVSNLAKKMNIKLLDMTDTKIFDYFDDANLEISNNLTGSVPAYIMFTSGSTGVPKGAVVSHANVLSFLGWSIDKFKINNNDRFAQVSPLYFDNSVFDFYTGLFSGASLVPIKKEMITKLNNLISLVDKLKCTIWFSVPSLLVYLQTMKALNRETFQSLRLFIFGGEGFPKAELKKLYDLYSDKAKLVNVYGPTEATCICSSHEISDEDFLEMNVLAPLGKLNPNFEKIIVNENMQEVKEGKKGELYLIGPNVALGYYNETQKTYENFIQNPFTKKYKDIIYKTGDIVYEKNGLLWFAGRTDNQIKHMGYRIELEEIEFALNGLNYINQSVVFYNREKKNYGKIISFVATDLDISESEIKKEINKILPNYMIPNVIMIKKELPKNANGKIDRKKIKKSYL